MWTYKKDGGESFRAFGKIETRIEIWWVAKDVCDVLGFSNSWKAVGDNVRPHQKSDLTIREVSSNGCETKQEIHHSSTNPD